MSDDCLIVEKQGALAVVTMNRPEVYNTFDGALRARMRETVANLEGDDDVRVVILKGAGRGFCAGADLAQAPSHPVNEHLDEEYKPFLTGMANGNKIYIAQVHGGAAGIGAAVAMNCDLVCMGDDAYIYMAFAAIALIPDGGNTQLLLQNMGYHRALESILEGQKVPAKDCLTYGIANKVFPAQELESQTMAWAQGLADGPGLAMAAAKRLLRTVGRMSYSDAISTEGLEQNALLLSEDCATGVQAFFRKEKPKFKGR